MKGREESEKAGLKFNIQKRKIMVSIPITSWQINGETVADCIIGGSQITADGDCNHEIKRGLVLGRKILTNLSSVQFTHSVVSNSLQPHGLQHAKFFCLSLSPRVRSNSCPSSRWCHPTTSSSVTPFSFCLQSFPASGSFPMSGLFASGGQSTEASALASVLPMNIRVVFL